MLIWGQAPFFNILLSWGQARFSTFVAIDRTNRRSLFATVSRRPHRSFGNRHDAHLTNPQNLRVMLDGIQLDMTPGMPRGPRLNIPGGIYHVMTRGNRKSAIFEDDYDRERFIDIAAEAAARHSVRVFVESRLGNHYHQVVQTPRANLPEYMAYLNGVFTQFSNHRHQRIGHLFNERYKPILIDDSFYLRIAAGYVLTNPVKHGFVDQPCDWKWSSYRATAGLETAPDYLYLDWLIEAFPSASLEDAQARLCRYLQAPTIADAEEWIDRPLVGSSQFERELGQHIGATFFMASLPRSYRAINRPPLSDLFQAPLPKAERNRQMLRAHVVHAYRLSEIARALYMHPASVSRIVSALRRKSRKL